jgi:hypothetical protein
MSERTNTQESTTPLSDVEHHLTYLKLSFIMGVALKLMGSSRCKVGRPSGIRHWI